MKKKKHVTLPRTYNPGKGHPKETLAYLSPAEHELIRKLTDGKWNRGPKGVKSYADDSASSKGVSRGDSSGTKGSGGLGQGGQGAGGNSGSKASSSPSGGVSTGGGMRGAGSNTGPGSGRPGSGGSATSGSSAGSGGQRGAGSNYGPGSGRPGSGGTFGGVARAAQENAARAMGPAPTTPGTGNRSWGNVLNSPYNTVFPERAPVTGVATSFPGRPRPGRDALGVPRVHAGLDFAATPGATVTPTVPGKVIQVSNSPSAYGPTVQVMNTFGVIDRYALHKPQDIPVKVGQSVYPGTALGVAGALQNKPNNFSHLHYERLTAADPGYSKITQGMQNGSLANNNRTVVGSSSSYSRQTGANVPDSALNSSTRDWAKSLGIAQNEALQRGANIRGPMDIAPISNTQVAGISNAGLGEADRLDRARKAAAGVSAIMQGASPLGPMQGPNMPPQGIPAPNSIGMLRSPYSGYGDFNPPQVRGPEAPQAPTHPIGGMSFAPDLPGEMPQAPKIAADPRVSLTPLGSLPAAKPPKEIQLAWNVPPIGGSLPPQTAWGLGQFGTYREKPKGPAANPGTIHTKTADAAPASAPAAANTSQWSWDNLRQAASTKVAEVQKQVDEVKQTAGWKFAQEHPKLAAFGLKMMMGGGGNPNSTLGTAQDRANYRMAPPQPPQQMAQAEQMPTDPLGTLNSLLANMIAKGAKPEEIAYVQSIINELTKTQVA